MILGNLLIHGYYTHLQIAHGSNRKLLNNFKENENAAHQNVWVCSKLVFEGNL
jgi:hypothetical protein